MNYAPYFLKCNYYVYDMEKKEVYLFFFYFSIFNFWNLGFSVSGNIFVMINCSYLFAEISRHRRNAPDSYERDYTVIIKYHKRNPFTNRRGIFILYLDHVLCFSLTIKWNISNFVKCNISSNFHSFVLHF